MRRSWKTILLGCVAVLALTASVTVAVAVPSGSQTRSAAGTPRPHQPTQAERDAFAAALAQKLGLSKDAVQKALEAVHSEMRPPNPSQMRRARARGTCPRPPENRLAAALAKKLGVSTDKVKAALAEVRKEHIQAEVAAGRLTQEQANRILANQRSGKCPPGPHPGGPPPGGPPPGPPPS